MTRIMVKTILIAMTVAAGCREEAAPPGGAAPAAVKTPAQTGSSETSRKVAKIVFIGQKEACECTRKRVDTSLVALEEALSGRTDIPVEKLDLDVDKAEAAVYQKLDAIMVVPAIYLLDRSGGLIEMLQGEVTPEQILIAIGG